MVNDTGFIQTRSNLMQIQNLTSILTTVNDMARKKQYVRRTEYEYRCIDGNWTVFPVAYCTYYHGALTQKMMKVHGCKKRNCQRMKKDVEFE